jgi:NAD(P)-dependent dehydrogenase (short-subunit alcohol dehydrogenase family)
MPTVLITGANRGLGLEFVRQYAADGWNIIACCRNPAKATELSALAQKNSAIALHTLEVTDHKAVDALAKTLSGTAIDVLINNAGVLGSRDISDPANQAFGALDYQAMRNVFEANIIAPTKISEALLPQLQSGQQKKIVIISSRMGSIADNTSGGYFAYRTSKTAANMIMRCMALALGGEHITVTSLHPGWVKTDMGGRDADITTQESIKGMRQVIAGLTPKQTGSFLNYKGETLPW